MIESYYFSNYFSNRDQVFMEVKVGYLSCAFQICHIFGFYIGLFSQYWLNRFQYKEWKWSQSSERVLLLIKLARFCHESYHSSSEFPS